MPACRLTGIFLAVLLLVVSSASMAETVVAKRALAACKTEALSGELHGYEATKDQKGVTRLIASRQCFAIAIGDPITIIRPGILTATIEHKGQKLYARADAIR